MILIIAVDKQDSVERADESIINPFVFFDNCIDFLVSGIEFWFLIYRGP
jgi:hypothetical protein